MGISGPEHDAPQPPEVDAVELNIARAWASKTGDIVAQLGAELAAGSSEPRVVIEGVGPRGLADNIAEALHRHWNAEKFSEPVWQRLAGQVLAAFSELPDSKRRALTAVALLGDDEPGFPSIEEATEGEVWVAWYETEWYLCADPNFKQRRAAAEAAPDAVPSIPAYAAQPDKEKPLPHAVHAVRIALVVRDGVILPPEPEPSSGEPLPPLHPSQLHGSELHEASGLPTSDRVQPRNKENT